MSPRTAARSKRSKSISQRASAASHLSHHERKCFICHHPERETIEEMFVHWHSPMTIYSRFMLRDQRTIYDHAHALGLFAKRRRNMRCALERIIERADERDISAHGIVAAIKAYASLTTSGEWVEPARRVIYTSISAPAPQREIANPLANQNGRRASSHALIDPSVTGDGWYTRNERNSSPPANPFDNKNGRTVYSAASNEPDLTGDGWYTRNEKSPTYSVPQKSYLVNSDNSQSSNLPPVAANHPNPQPAPPSPTAAHISTSSASASSQTAGASAPNSRTAISPAANASVPAPAGRASQTTTHTPAPAHTTTTVAPTNPKSANSTVVRANGARTPNSSRYAPGLEIAATHTKQSPAHHSNRHK
ncbi:MAG TPA: hypothetical protein VGU63_12390 [Candidatus Acidoferrales bacterium]|nr:hypothetical protein [Candidatus Acidoferrales bacterium]